MLYDVLSMSYCVVLHYIVLFCVVLYCVALCCVVVYCFGVLYDVVYFVLYYVMLFCVCFSRDNHSVMFAVRSRSPERATRGSPNAAGEGMCFIDGLGEISHRFYNNGACIDFTAAVFVCLLLLF